MRKVTENANKLQNYEFSKYEFTLCVAHNKKALQTKWNN